MKKRALLVALALVASDLGAADWKPLTGTYAVTAMYYLDPPEEDPKDSHFRIQLTGDAARELYLAMKVAEKRDECTNATAKQIGEMQCLHYKNQKKYTCAFSVNIAQQKIEYGVAC